MEHLFRDCPVSRRLWAGSELGLRTDHDSFLRIDTWIIDWLAYLEKDKDKEEQQLRFLATICWAQIVSTGIQAIAELKKDSCLGGNSLMLEGARVHWVRNSNPVCVVGRIGECGHVRVMVDAGWKALNRAGIGWIAMSDNGEIFNSTERKIKAESALQAEGLGVSLVLLWARDRGFRHLEVSSDCLSLILQIAGTERPHHLLKAILEDIQDCFSSFHCLAFSYIPRRFNNVAHSLACKAMDS
ncbi:uncharacterized protein LOC141632958 [Silene latifolia]|uniref:uncharacterized protein LOC141632958 n=1 Tax=Silene latifolia TaxID=37657 RepID=UPI003D773F13